MSSNTYSPVYHEDGNYPCFMTHSAGSMATFHCRFIDIVQKDSPGEIFGFSDHMQNAMCLDLDVAAKSLGGNNPSTLDCAFRVGNYNVINSKFSNPRWLLVELKLNSVEAQKDRKDLLKKVTDTEKGFSGETLDTSRNFIYNKALHSQKRNLFNSWKKGTNASTFKNWNCFSPEEFECFLLFKENLPYNPINESDAILASLPLSITPEEFDSQMQYWKRLAEEYKLKGNQYEYEHILAVLYSILGAYLSMIPESDEKEFLKEEWSFLAKYQ